MSNERSAMKRARDAVYRVANRLEIRVRNRVYHRANREKILTRKTAARAGTAEYSIPNVYQIATLR